MSMEKECDDYVYLKAILDRFVEMMQGGWSHRKAVESCTEAHMGGFERDEFRDIILIYRGKYILNFGQSRKVYKEVE